MSVHRNLLFAASVALAVCTVAPAMAAESLVPIAGAKKLTVTRVQVEVNCQGEGDSSYGVYGFGGYGCAKANGSWIECDAKGNCQSHPAYQRPEEQASKR
ncbi:hypothetical protein [Pelagibius sp.]|uniref:hypothetical protein n=1 Tax=Pelagibius sp. TaxID=1931238 RepID=UPI003BAE54D7